MSLQLAAQHLSGQGRGPDDTLVHMSKNELRSLNDLALAHGGQLTINPTTGLPEAGLLDKLLPGIIGAGISYFSGGTISPGMIGLGLGGFEAVRTGSLEKGLMAGLGAYGGAGLAGGLMGVGEASIGMGARDAAIKSATEQGLTGEAYNKAIQDQVAQQMAEKATPFGNISAGSSELFKNPMETLGNMGGQGGGLAGGYQTAKYAAGAAAPYLADAYKPTTDMPVAKPVEYRQYKVKRRPDMSYDYQALPVSNTFTPNFAGGGGISEAVGQYVDPSFKFKNVSGTKVETATNMPELKLAEGGRITPEEFMEKYMSGGANTSPALKYGAKGYADDPYAAPTNPYDRPEATPSDIVGVDGITYTWDPVLGKYVAKPGSVSPTTTIKSPNDTAGRGGAGYNSNQGNQTPGTTGPPTSMVEGGGNITPLAYPSLALSKMGDAVTNGLGYLAFKMSSPNPNPQSVQVSPTMSFNQSPNFTNARVSVGEGDAIGLTPGDAPPSVTVAPSVTSIGGDGGDGGGGATSGLSGISGPGVASTTPGNAVSSAMGGQSAAATGGGATGGGATGGGKGAPGAPGLGVSSGGGYATGPGGTSGVGGTGGTGGGTGCCFIMLEARYGDGTMDSVVRRYRDEKMTDKNRRGYYKLAEVFVPLMRESKVFKFLVTKTFADPLVSYGKYHYGENKHGWMFKPVEKFWMKVFNTLGSDTKFIRENGEVV